MKVFRLMAMSIPNSYSLPIVYINGSGGSKDAGRVEFSPDSTSRPAPLILASSANLAFGLQSKNTVFFSKTYSWINAL